jgi:hypothetical protein
VTTPFTWGARLLDAAGNPAAGATLAVELFDLASGKWIGIAQASTTSDGSVKARGEIADDTLPFAPAMRLVEGGAVMATTPAITRAGRGLNVDFGEVQRTAVAMAFARTIGRGAAPFRVGGGSTAAAPAVDMSALRAEVGRDFTAALAARDKDLADRTAQLADTQKLVAEREARLADNVRLVGEKDAEVRRLGSLLAAKDQEISALRAQPTAPSVDVAAVRAQMTTEFASRIAAKERDVADRDSIIAARDGQLADRARQLELKDAEIKRLIAEKDRITAGPAIARPELAAVPQRLAMTQLANSIGTQLDDAQTSLKSRGFSLGAIEVNAKGLLAGDGTQIEIPDREAMKALPPGVLSDFKLSFQPDPAAQDVGRQTVPDLAFLTENRVRAVLASLGLVLDASTGPATLNPQAAVGQAMLQTPAPGTAVPRGGRVSVIFAAPKP